MQHFRTAFPDGAAGKRAVLTHLSRTARAWAVRPAVRTQAVRIARTRRSSHADQAAALLEWTTDHIAFVSDVRGIETLQTPGVTLRLRAGDCDDQVMLLMSLAMAVGMRARPVGVGLSGRLTHVHAELMWPGSRLWVAADPTLTGHLGDVAPHDSEMIGPEV